MTAPEQRRRLRRLPREEPIHIDILDCPMEPILRGTTVSGTTLDVSSRGLRFRLDREIPVDTTMRLSITIDGGPPFELKGRVKWCRATLDRHGSLLGVELDADNTSGFRRWQQMLIEKYRFLDY